MNLRVITALFVTTLAIGIGFYVLMQDTEMPQSAPSLEDPFAPPTSGDGNATGGGGEANIGIQKDDGTLVYIPDPTRMPQPEGYTPEQGYELGGSDSGSYQILFFTSGSENRILISLLAEPLGETRKNAEVELRSSLKLSDADICALSNLEVWTLPSVNETYSGQDLGLSFCPGSILLP